MAERVYGDLLGAPPGHQPRRPDWSDLLGESTIATMATAASSLLDAGLHGLERTRCAGAGELAGQRRPNPSSSELAMNASLRNFGFIRAADKVTLARQLEASGRIVWEVDIGAAESHLGFIASARNVLPLDPPLVLGNSMDAFSDSFGGGMHDIVLSSGARDFALLLTSADALLERDPELLVRICVMLSHVTEGDLEPAERFTLLVLLVGEGEAFAAVG
jgi:hypothetical protein